MVGIEVISFDMEGTLIDHTFSNLIWEVDIPRLYGLNHGLDFRTAQKEVLDEYRQIGDEKIEWYNPEYWFKRFELKEDWRELLIYRRNYCNVYPEINRVLKRLSKKYDLIIASNTIREFLDVQLSIIPNVIDHVFSATSDFRIVKKSPTFYRKICDILGIQSDNMIHIGDHWKFDYEAARLSGVPSYYLDRIKKRTGDHVVHDLTEFEERIKGKKAF